MTGKDGNPKTISGTKRIKARFEIAGEEFRNCVTAGMEHTHANAKRLKMTTAEQRNRMEAVFDSSALNLISDLG